MAPNNTALSSIFDYPENKGTFMSGWTLEPWERALFYQLFQFDFISYAHEALLADQQCMKRNT